MKNYPSSIGHWDLNSRPLNRKSPPRIIRSGADPSNYIDTILTFKHTDWLRQNFQPIAVLKNKHKSMLIFLK